jgi:uncharacterized protein (TIGR00290 family)
MTVYASSRSGGKDSCLAYWEAIHQNIKISHLFNFIHADSTKAMSHGLESKLIALQAEAMGLPIMQKKVTWDTYEAGFKNALEKLKLIGVKGLFTGDIYLQEHKDWVDRVCGEAGEFHTFVYDEPSFKRPVKFGETVIVAMDDHWTLDIKEYEIG